MTTEKEASPKNNTNHSWTKEKVARLQAMMDKSHKEGDFGDIAIKGLKRATKNK